jgi:GNAT superfamily N-acetyltransferase
LHHDDRHIVIAVALAYRELRREEFDLLATIDRAEQIDGHYDVDEDGTLRLIADDFQAAGWYETELDTYVSRLSSLHDAGGTVLGTWDGDALVALASLDVRAVSASPPVLKLDMLYVSASHRHRGIGRRLVQMIADRARDLGATALYISATPTRNTVEAYLDMGAVLAVPPDPHLLALEPDDIHLVLPL